MYRSGKSNLYSKGSKLFVGFLVLVLLLSFIPIIPGIPFLDAYAEEVNLINNSSFETDDFAADPTAGKWCDTGDCTLTQDNTKSHSGSYSGKVSGRTDTWNSASYRLNGSDIALDKEYDLSGYAAVGVNTDMLMGMEIQHWNSTDGWQSKYITLVNWTTVTPGNWQEFATTLELTRTATATANEYEYTLTYGGNTLVFISDQNFNMNIYFNTGGTDEFWLDSFLLKAEAVTPPSGTGERTDRMPGNLIDNSSFEADDFAADPTVGKWCDTGASTLAQDNTTSHSGSYSGKVSGRTDTWNSASYRLNGSDIVLDKEYDLSGYAAVGVNTDMLMGMEIQHWNSTDGWQSKYITLVNWTTVTPGNWQAFATTLELTRTATATANEYEYTLTYGGNTLVFVSDQNFNMNIYFNTSGTDEFWLDSFLFRVSHMNETNTQEDADNVISNGGLEMDDFTADPTAGKWCDTGDSTLTQDSSFSHSGSSSGKVSGRTDTWNSASYRISGENLTKGREYDLSGYAAVGVNTDMLMGMEIQHWNSTDGWQSKYITLVNWTTVTPDNWKEFATTLELTRTATATANEYEYTLTYGGNTLVFISDQYFNMNIYFNTGGTNDFWLDSFLLKALSPPPPTGHADAYNTERDSNNLITNASIESSAFGTDSDTFGKWYPNQATLKQDKTYSHSGEASLLVTDRTDFWNRAEYKAEGSQFMLGREYRLSGYASSREDAAVDMIVTVYGYGGPSGDPYPNKSIYLAAGDTAPGSWTKLSGSFTITRKANADKGYYDLVISHSASGGELTIEHVKGLSGVCIFVQEQYDGAKGRTDLYLDSFLLKGVVEWPSRPTGHAGAYNTELDPDNLIKNASIEVNDFASASNFGKWYPAGGAKLKQDKTYSHSGNASLRITNRKLFWNRSEYKVEGMEIEPDRKYRVSGYASSVVDTSVDMIVEIIAYGGPADEPYPSQVIYLSQGDTRPGKWTKLSGSFMITEKPTDEKGYYDYTITHSDSDKKLKLTHVKGISGVTVMVQEQYNEAKYRTDLYLDSFRFRGEPENPSRPTGHTEAANPQDDPDNLIQNGSFERDAFSSKLQTGLWWPDGPEVTIAQISDYSHSGSYSLLVSDRTEHWHRAMYRIGVEDLMIGHEYELSGYFSSLEKTRAELDIAFWTALPDNMGEWSMDTMTVSKEDISPAGWTKLSATFKLTREGSDYVLTCNDEQLRIPAKYGIGCIEILPQLQPGTFNWKTDMYLDSFLVKDITAKAYYPVLEGHANQSNTEDIDENLINNSSFETDLLAHELNFGLWFTSGSKYMVQFTDSFSHSGAKSVRIYDRKNGSNALLYRVEATNIKYDVEHELSGWVAAAAQTEATLNLRVYGYDGNGGYPSETVALSTAIIGKDWINLKGVFSITYEDSILYLNTEASKTKIGECKGLSGIEFWVETKDSHIWPPDLYLDSFNLLAGEATRDIIAVDPVAVAGTGIDASEPISIDDSEFNLARVKGIGFSTQQSFLIAAASIVILGCLTFLLFWLLKRRKSTNDEE